MHEFKVGDRVRVLDNNLEYTGVLKGDEATVTHVNENFIGIDKGMPDHQKKPSWCPYHFELVKNPFQVGDEIECIEPDKEGKLAKYQVYTVTARDDKYVGINGNYRTDWRFYRFSLYRSAPKVSQTSNKKSTMKQARLSNGRFTSVTPAAPAVTQFNKLALKRGSLYRVVGGSVGRYVGGDTSIKGVDYVVISTHGKPEVVKRALVRKADKEDVVAYLDKAGV